jgi:predicted short-subunit dehydrogenase-like oxidoreductase (DUF2520 family)
MKMRLYRSRLRATAADMLSTSIIGLGRVGTALALSLPSSSYRFEQLVFRSERPDTAVPGETFPIDRMQDVRSDILLIATQDAEVESLAKQLVGRVSADTRVLHTSGALSSLALKDLAASGCSVGSLHPLVSISDPYTGAERFRGAYFCIEGDPAAVEVGKRMATDLGGNCFTIATEKKALYHAAAVTSCGHVVALFDAASDIMSRSGVSAEDARKLLMPLLQSTVDNLRDRPPAEALTGTFARADIATFSRHISALGQEDSDDLLEIYLLLGERSLELAAKAGLSNDRLEKLRTKLFIAKSKVR